MKSDLRKNIILGVLSMGLILVGSYAIYLNTAADKGEKGSTETLTHYGRPGEISVVELTGEGFSPSELHISSGQTVQFVSKKGEAYWPASNIHPSHAIYPEFDPKEPVPPDESWSFTFKEPGEYRYHDHLFPSHFGVIYVKDADSNSVASGCENEETGSSNQNCWDIRIHKGYKEGGLKGAFEAISELYKTEPRFLSESCHRYAHLVGDLAFEDLSRDVDNYENWEFPQETTYCGYGFYHGLFEHLFRENPDIELAVGLCENLIERLEDDIPAIKRNCYHAMGHGFMPDPPPKEVMGDPMAMTETPMKLCRQVSDDKVLVDECLQGIFNVIADWVDFGYHGLSKKEGDELWICREQGNKTDKEACYYEFGMRAAGYAGDDILEVSRRFAEDIESDEIAKMIVHSASASVVEHTIGRDDFSSNLYDCRKLPERVRESCLLGIVGGLIAHGEPDNEYEKVINFCGLSIMSPDEKESCYFQMIRDLSFTYPKDRMMDICPLIKDDKYVSECRSKVSKL